MKKSILSIAILFSIFSVFLSSCNKDEAGTPEQLGGKYNLVMNGNTIASGETEEVGMLGNAASVSKGEDLSILVANVPETTGAVFQFNDETAGGTVSIMGKNLLLSDNTDELYFSVTGSIKRESATKISFQGTCIALGSSTVHTFSGTIESEAFRLI